jgi:hypothetical protein
VTNFSRRIQVQRVAEIMPETSFDGNVTCEVRINACPHIRIEATYE